ncbi:MAG: DUF3090 family protein [Actinomycetota bacterium]
MSELEFDAADVFTTGALGEPGRRVFMLQASKGPFLQTWILEKEQVVAMARGGYELLSQIGEHEMTRELLGRGMIGASSPEFTDAMSLKQDEPAFRVDGETITMTYEQQRHMIRIGFAELIEPGFGTPASVGIWVTPRQLASFGIQGMKVVAQGRPICPLCGHPMDDEGHHCPASNGHNPRASG